MLSKKICLVVIILLISPFGFSSDSRNLIGVNYYLGVVDAESTPKTKELNDITTTHIQLYYDRLFSDYFSFGASYTQGDSNDFQSTIFDLLTDSHIDYNYISLNAKFYLPISMRSSLYFGLKTIKYNYDIVDDNEVVENDDGVDIGFSTGWMYRWGNGVGFDLNLHDRTDIGSDLTLKTLGVGLNYNF